VLRGHFFVRLDAPLFMFLFNSSLYFSAHNILKCAY